MTNWDEDEVESDGGENADVEFDEEDEESCDLSYYSADRFEVVGGGGNFFFRRFVTL